MDLIEWVLVAAIKRSAGASQQISHAQTDDDRHQRGDELETAHEILHVLHGELSLIGTESGNRVTNVGLGIARVSRANASPARTERVLAIANFLVRLLRVDVA